MGDVFIAIGLIVMNKARFSKYMSKTPCKAVFFRSALAEWLLLSLSAYCESISCFFPWQGKLFG
jgi:hypothetical protein